MAPVDNRDDRIYWAISNMAVATFVSLPLMWGLTKETSLKFIAGIGGTVVAVNAIRLLDLHEQGVPVRSAWSAAGQMVNCAWIEEMALAILPHRVQQQEFAGSGGSAYYLPPPQFQLAAPPSESENLPDRGDGRTKFIQNGDRLLGVELPAVPDFGVKFFDWRQFRENPDNFSHIRGVGATNSGKTTLIDWLMDVFPADRKIVHTIKRKPHQWKFLEVIGVPEDFEAIRRSMLAIRSERIRRTRLMESGKDFPRWSAAFDEWKVTSKNIKAIVDRKTKEIISPSAKELQGENLALARELKIRIFALAQGRQVITWGLEGESDMLECFTSIFLGKFAVEECESYRNKFSKDSEQYSRYQQVRDYLESIGNRAAWISSEVGEFPAIVPGLSGWRRQQAEFSHQAPQPSDTPPRSFSEAFSPEPENPRSPARMPGVDLEATYDEIVNSGGKLTVYGSDWEASDAETFELAKLVIARIPGIEKRIFYLWGATSGGEKNHQKYKLAREWLDRLLEQIKAEGDTI